MDTGYSVEGDKYVYNYYKGDIIKFPSSNDGRRHAYTVKNTVKEVPKGIFEQMLNDGLITRPEYNKLIKNKK